MLCPSIVFLRYCGFVEEEQIQKSRIRNSGFLWPHMAEAVSGLTVFFFFGGNRGNH